jgi:LacI family transcriptional regulator
LQPGAEIRLPWRKIAAEVMLTLEAVWAGKSPTGPVLISSLEIVARGSSSFEAVSDILVRRSMQSLISQIASIKSVEDWATQSGVSRRVFERRFQAALGRSPLAMIQMQRIERAKILLSTTEIPISLIAERCGYQSNERLSVNFRALTGMSPANYRHSTRDRSM